MFFSLKKDTQSTFALWICLELFKLKIFFNNRFVRIRFAKSVGAHGLERGEDQITTKTCFLLSKLKKDELNKNPFFELHFF